MHTIGHQTVLASDIAAFDRIELKSQRRTAAGIVVDFGFQSLRVNIFEHEVLYRYNGVVLKPLQEYFGAGFELINTFRGGLHAYPKIGKICAVYDGRPETGKIVDVGIVFVKVLKYCFHRSPPKTKFCTLIIAFFVPKLNNTEIFLFLQVCQACKAKDNLKHR